MFPIQDRVFVLTGGSGGMGRAICKELIARGGKVAVCSNDAAGLEAMELPGDALRALVDVTSEAEVAAFFDQVKAQFGGADALLNLAGLSIPAPVATMTEADYDTVMDVNVKGTMLACKHFLPLARPSAQIISIGSMAALRANNSSPVYCAAKAAVNMLDSCLQLQTLDKDVRVTTLNPGGADTPFWGTRAVAREKLLKSEDVARVVLFVLEADPHIAFHELNFESFNMMKK